MNWFMLILGTIFMSVLDNPSVSRARYRKKFPHHIASNEKLAHEYDKINEDYMKQTGTDKPIVKFY